MKLDLGLGQYYHVCVCWGQGAGWGVEGASVGAYDVRAARNLS